MFARGLEQELGVDLNDGEEVIELVCDKTGRPVRLFEIASSLGEVDRRCVMLVLS